MTIVTLCIKLMIGFLLTCSVYSTTFSLTTSISNVYNTNKTGTRSRSNEIMEMGENETKIQNELNSKDKTMNKYNSVELKEINIILSRVHRSLVKRLTIEVSIFIDSSMQKHYDREELHIYVNTLMYIVAGIFRDPSTGNSIDIALVEIINLRNEADQQIFSYLPNYNNHQHDTTTGLKMKPKINATAVLQNFCKWQSSHHGAGHNNYFKKSYDTAILLTQNDLCTRSHDSSPCTTRGLANIGTICNRNRSCAIIQDDGLSTAFTIGHEMGHLLNVEHDNEPPCLKLKKDAGEHGVFIMNNMLGSGSDSMKWSICSRNTLTKFLDSSESQCLENRRDSLLRNHDEREYVDQSRLPGLIYNVNEQCRLATGFLSTETNHVKVTDCSQMSCSLGPKGGHIIYPNPWADGTSCTNGNHSEDQFHCIRAQCVQKANDEDLRIVHGGWGDWGEPSKCSRACNGGVRFRKRECNRPIPRNGGRFCLGERQAYESCNTRNCGECFSESDFRAEQCSTLNGNNFNYPTVPSNVIWTPYLRVEGDDRCKLLCLHQNVYYWLNKKNLIDGTKCDENFDMCENGKCDSSLQNFDMCVNGKCVKAGCDHVINSTKTVDFCGECGGNNSTCKIVTGKFNNISSDTQEVVRIPRGAFAILVTQESEINPEKIPQLPKLADDFHLMLVDPASNKSLLNTYRFLHSGQLKVNAFGISFNYTGINTVVESLTSPSSSTMSIESDAVIKVFRHKKQYNSNPRIYYEYYIPKTTVKKKSVCPSGTGKSNTSFDKTFSNFVLLSIIIFQTQCTAFFVL